MRTRLSILAVLLACAAPRPQPPRGAEVFRVDGKVENAPFVFGRDDLPSLPRRAFEARPPAGEPRKFEGVSLDVLLEDRMELKREADTAVLVGAGGVTVPVPLAAIRQLRPVLADVRDLTGGPHSGAPVLSVAWPTVEHPGIETDPRFRWWWVAGVQTVHVESWIETYGRALRVPVGASDDARLGAAVLGSQCIGCHRVRGAGGTRGPELTAGAGPSLKLRSHSPALRDHLRAMGERTAPELAPVTAARVAAFLDAVVRAGPEREDAASGPASDDTARGTERGDWPGGR